jgi:carboxypeptidase family protein
MKLLSPKAHPLRLLSIFFFTSTLLLIVSGSPPSAADDVTQEGWRVEIEEGQSTRATLTINNRCTSPHLFRIKSSAKFLRFEQPTDSIQIQAKSNKQIGAQFEATGLTVKVYRSKVTVECLDCKKEPGCNQDRDELPVEMIVVKTKKIVVPRPSGSIMGRVVDPRNTPVRGAEVRIPGQPVVFTNGRGEFDIRSLAATERLGVSFSAPGFIDTTRIYKVGGHLASPTMSLSSGPEPCRPHWTQREAAN